MTAKDKAVHLFTVYLDLSATKGKAIQCAIINIESIIEALKVTTGHLTLNRLDTAEVEKDFAYWQQVLTELNKM